MAIKKYLTKKIALTGVFLIKGIHTVLLPQDKTVGNRKEQNHITISIGNGITHMKKEKTTIASKIYTIAGFQKAVFTTSATLTNKAMGKGTKVIKMMPYGRAAVVGMAVKNKTANIVASMTKKWTILIKEKLRRAVVQTPCPHTHPPV